LKWGLGGYGRGKKEGMGGKWVKKMGWGWDEVGCCVVGGWFEPKHKGIKNKVKANNTFKKKKEGKREGGGGGGGGGERRRAENKTVATGLVSACHRIGK